MMTNNSQSSHCGDTPHDQPTQQQIEQSPCRDDDVLSVSDDCDTPPLLEDDDHDIMEVDEKHSNSPIIIDLTQ